ncbi:UV radiation resistance protein and autophagy-related subunit 14-domain-containing protein, partial [Bisporella sp. PMI_857]
MQCDICTRPGSRKLPLLCAMDARNRLYESRIRSVELLLEKDSLDQRVGGLLSHARLNGSGLAAEGKAGQLTLDYTLAEKEQVMDRTQAIIAHADELRHNVEKAREEIAKRKANNERIRAELASVSSGVERKRTKQIEFIEKAHRMTKYEWNRVHTETAKGKAFLCGEAADLYGLRRVRRKGSVTEYKIGGIGIVDLRSMNKSSPAQINTALSHIVHLLMLSAHYLAVRLPAEITLPHRNHPLPTIYNLSTSYKPKDIPLSSASGEKSSSISPTTSRHPDLQKTVPHARPLYIDKPLPLLLKEEPIAYSLFLEGVSLLAYNIIWLCKSQGIPTGEFTSFEDICDIGKNFYNLLIGFNPQSSRRDPHSRVSSTQTTPTKNGQDSSTDDKKAPISIMGRYTHGSAHSFLGNAYGNEYVRGFKLPNPLKITDKLKYLLQTEAANGEWEVLDQDAWAVDDEMGDDGIVVGARREANISHHSPLPGMQSFMSMRTVVDAVEMV